MANIGARLAAVFTDRRCPATATKLDGEIATKYYKESITDRYSRIYHETTAAEKGYAFPYDDVGSASTLD
jgi:Beta-1,3-glucanase